MNTPTELTLDQKRDFYNDGFIVLRDIVPRELTRSAKRRIHVMIGREGSLRRHYKDLSVAPELPALVNETSLGDLLRNTMGEFDPPVKAMPTALHPFDASETITSYGVPGTEIPNFGFVPHLDGQWAGRVPRNQNEVDNWQSPRTEHFGTGDAANRGGNNTPLFQDPACKLSIGSFTAFVGVALNDQTEFGRGNLAVLRGAHHAVEDFFRMQRDSGGVVGPEGEGWPRLRPIGESGVTMNHLPQTIRDQFSEGSETTPDGTKWLKPTPILLDEGDAVITLHAIPHCGTSNRLGHEPRMNVYFRLRRHRPGGATVLGDSDHPDRGWNGEFLDYPDGYNPWEVAIEKLCDHWSEWDGMKEFVAEQVAQ